MPEAPHAAAPAARDVSRRWLVAAVVAAGLLLVVWSLVVPIFEAPDEPQHWQVARMIHDTWTLPRYGPDAIEANQPPLYYVAIAPLATKTPTPPVAFYLDGLDHMATPFRPRLFHNAGDDLDRYWPLRLARLLTAALAAVTVIWCVFAGLEATGRRSAALVTAAFAGLLPQFSFRGGNISNDALAATMGALLLYLVVRLARRGFSWGLAIVAAVALAAAYLTKISAIGLAPTLALVILAAPACWLARLVRLTVVLGVALLVVAPWSLRNVALYGDPFASGAMTTAVPGLIVPKPLLSRYFVTHFPRVIVHSFVGHFGWLNVPLPVPAVLPYVAAGLLAGCGLVYGAWAATRVPLVAVAALAATVGTLLVVVHINLSFNQPQGRYLFPALGPIALLVALGLRSWPWWQRREATCAKATAVVLLALNVLALFRVVVPAYYPAVTPVLSRAHRELPDGGDGQHAVLAGGFDAADYVYLQFDIVGTAATREQRGRLWFKTQTGEQGDVGFDWAADGRRRRLTIALLPHPAWRGRIAELRVKAVSDGGIQGRDHVSMSAFALVGSLGAYDY